jgi:peptide deformylase
VVVPIRRIVITGETVLHQPALPVGEITLEIKELVADMFDTMTAAPGVGLAATQVGVGLRIFVYDYEQDEIHYQGVAINPALEVGEIPDDPADEDMDSEGCLSIPGERFPLKRSDISTLHATDLDGVPYSIKANGWLARIFQHEFDHLDGVLYADRLIKPYQKELKKIYKFEGWGVPGQSWLPGEDDLEA